MIDVAPGEENEALMRLSRYDVSLMNRRLFFQKLASLLIAVALLFPLVYFRLRLPSLIYVIALLVLHLYVVYLYLHRVSWNELLRHRTALAGRVVAVLFFGYILTVLKFSGAPGVVLSNLSVATAAHVAILVALMVKITKSAD
jgi:phosphatidylserine synthase